VGCADNAYPTPPFVKARSYIVAKHIPPIGCAARTA